MTKFRAARLLTVLGFLFSLIYGHHSAQACVLGFQYDGFFPKNQGRDPNASFLGSFAPQGIDVNKFNEIIDDVSKIYEPIIASRGGKLVVQRKWSDKTINAYATRNSGNVYNVVMFGGLARDPATSPDGFALVLCHELGHHLAGFPKVSGGLWSGAAWASNEGQSDYFATTKCLRRYYIDQNNSADYLSSLGVVIPKKVQQDCSAQWGIQSDEYLYCVRSTLAGLSISNLFASLSKSPKAPDVTTPDRSVIAATMSAHPPYQCRLDTYFQGALCSVDHSVDFNETEEFSGACTKYAKHTTGLRPQCWFKPNAAPPAPKTQEESSTAIFAAN